ncbi:hypothetical protein DYB34_004842 [Aphanomyces astaci]|uniref:GP-PDE domain-containing protein n=1 Tax=Aphanomyces astaci TaxID=112090 RepID=A0A3R6WZ54_APHAT|nr:hypothetical protein DYB34_004842 [Aphanomyces astaci]
MIEFDVQLSRDRVPVIYHDFFLHAKLGHRVLHATMMSKMGLHDLTLAQLNQVEWRHCSQPNPSRLRSLLRKHWLSILALAQPPPPSFVSPMQALCDAFPTLRLAFDHVPLHVGFNIEIKYPADNSTRHLTALPSFEVLSFSLKLAQIFKVQLNAYVDAILDVVMAFGRSRHVVFSCFAPDVCVLLRAKQSTYRVYFLTCGVDVEHLVWDTRCIALNHAVAFSQVEQLHGIVTNSDPLLDKPALIPAIKNNTQLDVFTWGDHNTSHAHSL